MKKPTELTFYVKKLEEFLRQQPDAPVWDDIVIEQDGKRHSVQEYIPYFQRLAAKGYSWINLTCLGIDNRTMIAHFEVPEAPSGIKPEDTSINISGPEKTIRNRKNWSNQAL